MTLRHPLLLSSCVLALLAILSGCGNPTSGPGTGAPGSSAGGCDYVARGEPAKPVEPPPTGVVSTGTATSVVKTNEGDVVITMDRSKTPCTVNSFVSLARQGYFDNTRCHRLTDAGLKVLQCGDPTGTGTGGPGYGFASETDGTESYVAGVVAMANAGPNTNGSQFFLVWGDSTQLDQTPNYTIFGRMDTASLAVVAQIAAEGQDGSNGEGDGRPNNPAEIVSVTER